MISEIPNEVKEMFSEKFNVLAYTSFLAFDRDISILENLLINNKKQQFNHNDRIIVVHMDTDFYFEECSVGVTLKNFFTIIEKLDLPKFIFLFYTNHFGIKKEVDILCKNYHAMDRPTVIETMLSTLHCDPTQISKTDLCLNDIQYNALCMMVTQRSHRNAFANLISDIPKDKLALNLTKKNDKATYKT